MSAIGSVSTGAAFAVQVLPKKSVSSTPDMAFGKAKWEKYFGDIGIEPILPPNIKEIINSPCPFWPDKKVKETHLLVLVPETVNGNPFHLDALGEMIQNPKIGHKTNYQSYVDKVKKELGNQVEKSHWVLMTRDVIPKSRAKSYEKQKAWAQKHAGKNGVDYEMPKILEAATAILTEHASTGTQLYRVKPCTYTRCQEKVGVSRFPVAIGGLSSEGVNIGINYYDNPNSGVAACGRL